MKYWRNQLAIGLVVIMLGIAPLHGVWAAPTAVNEASEQNSHHILEDLAQAESPAFFAADHCVDQHSDHCGSELDCSGSHCDFGVPWNFNSISRHTLPLSVDDPRTYPLGIPQPHFRPPRSYRA